MFAVICLKLALILLCVDYVSLQSDVDVRQVQCLVCQALVGQIEKEIEKFSPNRKIDIARYRLDGSGNSVKEKVEYRRSEVFLSELFDNICNSMEDWIKARYKSNGELVVMPIMIDGQMNPIFNEVDVIQDPDLNKNIKLYCQSILDDYDDDVLRLFRQGGDSIKINLCSDATDLCEKPFEPEEDYLFEDEKDEL